MARLLILCAILAAIVWFLYWFRTTPPHRVSQVLRKAVLWGLVALLIVAAATGRLNPIFAAIGAAIPVLIRLANLLRLLPAVQQLLRQLGLGGPVLASSGAGSTQQSSIRTRYLEMCLDHASGLELYRESDAQSAAVLEAYLDRERESDWRERDQTSGRGSGTTGLSERLTKAEAWSILGLEPGADAAAIRAAHRRLMQRLHPDRGGSDYLAAKINEAKRLLLGE